MESVEVKFRRPYMPIKQQYPQTGQTVLWKDRCEVWKNEFVTHQIDNKTSYVAILANGARYSIWANNENEALEKALRLNEKH